MQNDPLRVVEEMKRLAVEMLGGVPASLYGPIEDALQESSLRAGAPGARRLEQAALITLRQHSATYTMRFRQQIAVGFDDLRALRFRQRSELPLGLVDESQLDFHLSGQQLAEGLGGRYAQPLELMESRLEQVTIALGVPSASNPIGAARLAAAFIETYRDAQLPDSLRPLMFRQYEQELARLLGDLYGRINSLLVTSGYPGLIAVPRPLKPASSATSPAPLATTELDSRTTAALDELRSQLHRWRHALAPDAQTDANPRRELRIDEVVSVASLLQAAPPDVYARALAGSGRLADAIREDLSEGARRLGINPDQTRFSEHEEDAIDLVALLFESLFRNHTLMDRARRLYARLVLPYVKVAMLDHALFVQAEHPARRVLDALTEACEGNAAATPQDRELLERAAAVSQRIVADYNQDIAVFELACAELDALLAQQRQRIEMQGKRAAKAAYGRERLSQARSQADVVLARTLLTTPLTQAVGDFLAGPWRHHLVQSLLREGVTARHHGDALALGEGLLEADRLAAQHRGAALADRLIDLQAAIEQCLASSGHGGSSADHGMAELVRALATPDAARRVHPLPPADTADEEEDAGMHLAGGTDTLNFDPAVAARLRRLLPGEWLRLTDEHGDTVPAKVAWISPLTSRFLLVNRRGLRVLVASAEELAALAAVDRLAVGAERTPVDEAMRLVRHRLGRAAA